MHGFMMLCDFAETLNGKLYIQGGGWTRVGRGPEPLTMFLAAKVFVPWTETNRNSRIVVSLATGDGQEVELNGQPVKVEGEFEVGRPPGLPAGTEIDLPLSFRFQGLPLDPGRYVWTLMIADAVVATTSFDVLAA